MIMNSVGHINLDKIQGYMKKSKTNYTYCLICRIIIPALLIICISQYIYAAGKENNRKAGLARLEAQAEVIWGSDNTWLPEPTLLVQYERGLGERSMVDFARGKACVQIILRADDDPCREAVLAHLKQGVGNLILRKPEDPVEMIKSLDGKARLTEVNDSGKIEVPPEKEIRTYIVQRGDSMWKISNRFGMKTGDLARLNKLNKKETLHLGQPIKVFVYAAHDLTLDTEPESRSDDPLLLDQIRMADGRPVHRSTVRDFAEDLLKNQPPEANKITGIDGIERLAVSVRFNLVPNHVEIRARKFYPIVLKEAEKKKLDPAVIMAIIHTESMFNPMARSSTPAYGLMQLVPGEGALEAYNAIHDKDKKLTPQYLYNPKNNIELGTTYYKILKTRYMGDIDNPVSRVYCAVAAYNAGASNVGYAFISTKSINQATSRINRMKPQKVYQTLINKLSYKESRNYVRKVFTFTKLYRNWDKSYR